jgi:hypothetical protein
MALRLHRLGGVALAFAALVLVVIPRGPPLHPPGLADLAAPGVVWVLSEESDLLVRVDAASGRVASRIPVCDWPTAVTATGDSVWIACAGPREVWRLDVADGEPIVTELDGVPADLVIQADGVWVAVRES